MFIVVYAAALIQVAVKHSELSLKKTLGHRETSRNSLLMFCTHKKIKAQLLFCRLELHGAFKWETTKVTLA